MLRDFWPPVFTIATYSILFGHHFLPDRYRGKCWTCLFISIVVVMRADRVRQFNQGQDFYQFEWRLRQYPALLPAARYRFLLNSIFFILYIL